MARADKRPRPLTTFKHTAQIEVRRAEFEPLASVRHLDAANWLAPPALKSSWAISRRIAVANSCGRLSEREWSPISSWNLARRRRQGHLPPNLLVSPRLPAAESLRPVTRP